MGGSSASKARDQARKAREHGAPRAARPPFLARPTRLRTAGTPAPARGRAMPGQLAHAAAMRNSPGDDNSNRRNAAAARARRAPWRTPAEAAARHGATARAPHAASAARAPRAGQRAATTSGSPPPQKMRRGAKRSAHRRSARRSRRGTGRPSMAQGAGTPPWPPAPAQTPPCHYHPPAPHRIHWKNNNRRRKKNLTKKKKKKRKKERKRQNERKPGARPSGPPSHCRPWRVHTPAARRPPPAAPRSPPLAAQVPPARRPGMLFERFLHPGPAVGAPRGTHSGPGGGGARRAGRGGGAGG